MSRREGEAVARARASAGDGCLYKARRTGGFRRLASSTFVRSVCLSALRWKLPHVVAEHREDEERSSGVAAAAGNTDGEQRHDAGEERDRELLPGDVGGGTQRGHRGSAGRRRGGPSSSGGEEEEEGAASPRAHRRRRRRHWQAAAEHHRQEELQVPWGQQVAIAGLDSSPQ